MGTFWWCMEFIKVLLAYIVLMFAVPSLLFRNYLRGKDWTFQFSFCVSAQVMLVSTVVLMLGLVHLLYAWVLRVLFYGGLAVFLLRGRKMAMTPRYLVYKLQNRSLGLKLLRVRIREGIRGRIRAMLNSVWEHCRENLVEIIGLGLLVGFGIVYFSYGALQERYYGFGDMYVHHSWIYGLIQGQSFSGGIYPEAMHCVIYAIYALFGIRVYSVLMFLQGIHTAVFLIAAYILIRELFGWKYTGMAVLAVFLTMKMECVDEVYGMSRLQWTLPQEFGLYAVFTIPTFLIRYLKQAGSVEFRGKMTKNYWDENLVIFCLTIAASFAIHFYTTIMAILTCAGVVLVWLRKTLNWKRLYPLGCTAILAVLIAAVPMVLAFAEGIPLQGSLYWAMNVMNGIYDTSGSTKVVEQPEETTPPDNWFDIVVDEDGVMHLIPVTQPEEETEPEEEPAGLMEQVFGGVLDVINRNVNGTYSGGYKTLYKDKWAPVLVLFTAAAFALCVLYRLLRRLFKVSSHRAELLDGYAMAAVMSILMMVVYASPYNDFPSLIAGSRLCAVEHMILVSLVLIPLDLLGMLLAAFCSGWGIQAVSLAAAAALCTAVVTTGNYHGYLYYEGSRYTAAAEVTNSIIRDIPKDQFTVISTTDELYQLIEYGFHEEYLDLMDRYQEESYYIPTQYLFFYLEKRPIQYGQSHYLTGPKWLGLERYPSYLSTYVSQCPEVSGGAISKELVGQPLIEGSKQSDSYTILYNREIVESTAAAFLEELQQRYPNEMTVYYEDDDFVCYCLKQNPKRLFNLVIDGE